MTDTTRTAPNHAKTPAGTHRATATGDDRGRILRPAPFAEAAWPVWRGATFPK